MNATKWSSLTELAKHLGREGLCIVDETEKGWFVQWVDRNPKTLAKQEAIAKKERMEKTDAEREKMLLEQQMERAKQTAKEEEKEVYLVGRLQLQQN
jgi:DNA/RNA-binding protein KIN17